jgi:hypothetical protein
MRDLHGLADASALAYLTVWNRGGGTMVASRQSSDRGVHVDRDRCVRVRLLQGDAEEPSWRSSMRSCAMGGRKT